MTSILPETALNQHIGVLGKTRSGKSSVMRAALVEPLLEARLPVSIIDPKGDWWGIKSSHSGKRAGYPVVIFGGAHADVPINEHAGKHVAELVATGNRPCLIDLGGWRVGPRTRFYIDFAQALFLRTRGRRWLVIDEVHNFAPQAGGLMSPDSAEMLHWSNRLASEGLGKGLALIVASQRPQKVHKDLITSMETLIAMRVLHKLDRKAIGDWLEGCGDPQITKDILTTIAQLERGEGWVWSPEIGFGPKRVKFPMFKTYDSFAPQPVDQAALKGWAEVNLDDVRSQLESVVLEARENDPTLLKKRIRELEAGLKKAAAATPATSPAELELWKTANDELRRQITEALTWGENMQTAYDTARTRLDIAIGNARESLEILERDIVVPTKPTVSVPAAAAPRPRPSPARDARTTADTRVDYDGEPIPAGPQKTLIAIAQHPDGIGQSKLRPIVGAAARTLRNNTSWLRTRGMISRDWPVRITDAGLAVLGDSWEPLPLGDALRSYWLSRLRAGPKRTLHELANVFPAGLTSDELAERTDCAPRTVRNNTSHLKVRHLIEKRGDRFFASEDLFG